MLCTYDLLPFFWCDLVVRRQLIQVDSRLLVDQDALACCQVQVLADQFLQLRKSARRLVR